MKHLVEGGPRAEDINDEEAIPENESVRRSGYNEPTHDNVRRMIQDFLKEREEDRLICLIDGRCEKVVLKRFQKAQERAKTMSIHLCMRL